MAQALPGVAKSRDAGWGERMLGLGMGMGFWGVEVGRREGESMGEEKERR